MAFLKNDVALSSIGCEGRHSEYYDLLSEKAEHEQSTPDLFAAL